MDLEHVLFGLSTFVNDCEEQKLSLDNVYKESYLKLLDQLAVLLRDENLRDDPLIRSNLSKFVSSADYLLVNLGNAGFEDVLSEVIRVLANAVAENPGNRIQLANNKVFVGNLGTHLSKNPSTNTLNERILILLKNLVIDSENVAKDVSFITQNILIYINHTNDDIFMAVDLLTDLVKHMNYNADVQSIEDLQSLLLRTLEKKSELDDDEFAELVVNISTILESLTEDPRLKFTDNGKETSVQAEFFDLLERIDKFEFQNKLMAQRRLFASIGNVSANLSASNKPLREFALKNINDRNQSNGYIISASFILVGNSISSSADRDEVLDLAPALLDNILSKYNYLVDPVQFQGILHILKTLISFDTVGSLFTETNFKYLDSLIEATVRNSRYYTNFTVLLAGFLKKLFVLLSQRNVEKIVNSDIPKHLTSSDPNNESNTIILLLLNKIALYKIDSDIEIFCSRIFKFTTNIAIGYMFELTKTVGVLLQHRADYVLDKYTDSLITLLTTINSIDSESNDNAAKAVLNNGRYIAGSILNLSKSRTINPELAELSEKVLRK